MFNKSFSEINSSDIEGLLTSGASEHSNLEFKKQIWGTADEEVREMLRDISSIANAYGGYLIVGIDEEDDTGKAKEIINVSNAEQDRDRILASCMANLHPRIIGLDIKMVECKDNKKVILIKIPDSLNLHQITFKGLYQFWKRHDRQKSRMTYEEIKDNILKNNLASSQNISLLKERQSLMNGRGRSVLMLTVQPIKPEAELFKVGNEKVRDIIRKSGGERRGGWHLNFNSSRPLPSINGLIINDTIRKVEFFRNGYTEAVIELKEDYGYLLKDIASATEGLKVIRSHALVEFTYTFLIKVQALMKEVGYDAPMSFSINLININGFALSEPEGRSESIWSDGSQVIIEPLTFEFLLPEIIAKELCDRLWQAFGFEESPHFKLGKLDFT